MLNEFSLLTQISDGRVWTPVRSITLQLRKCTGGLDPVSPGLSPILWGDQVLKFTEERVLIETAFGFKLAVNACDDHRYYSNGHELERDVEHGGFLPRSPARR